MEQVKKRKEKKRKQISEVSKMEKSTKKQLYKKRGNKIPKTYGKSRNQKREPPNLYVYINTTVYEK